MSEKEKETASLKGGLSWGMSIHPYDGTNERRAKAKKETDLNLYGAGLLGEDLAPKRAGNLSERFGVPPFSVLNAREGWWQDRKRAWLALGIQSELGRGDTPSTSIHVAPGGSLMPAMDYKKGERGTGAGKAIPGTATTKRSSTPVIVCVGETPSTKQQAAPRVVVTRAEPLILEKSVWKPPSELPSLRGVKRLGLDIETKDPDLESLGPGCRRPGNYAVGYSLAHEGGTWYLPIRHEGGGNLDLGLVLDYLREELGRYDGEIVGTNLAYDLDWAATDKIEFPNVIRFLDVQVAEPLLDENKQGQYNLGALARHHLGEGKDERLLLEAATAHGVAPKSGLWQLPAAYVGAYAEADAALPLRIIERQLVALEAEGLLDLFLEVETPLIPLLVAMRRRGVRVDVPGAERARATLVEERDRSLATVRRLAGPRAELMAPESFVAALMDRGLSFPRTPKTNKPSVTKGWLNEHRGDALVDAVLAGRRVSSIITTFIDGHILGHAINGRVHCEFNQLKGDLGGTIARFSSSNPNLQNIPARDDELAALIRGLFLPEEGEVWEQLDESQIEYRFLVHYARGPGGEEARRRYSEDPATDFHALCGDMLGLNGKDRAGRKRVKGINFCKVYGGGVHKLMETIGCEYEEAELFTREYDEKLPFVTETFNAAAAQAQTKGYVKTVLGRRRRFPLWEPLEGKHPALPREAALEKYGARIKRAFTYKALNGVLQGSAADHQKKAMVDLWRSGICTILGTPLLTVHDELDWSRPQTPEGGAALLEAKRIIEAAIPLRVPVVVDRQSGPNWGTVKRP